MGKVLKRFRFMVNLRKLLPFLYDFYTSKAVKKRTKLLSLVLLFGYLLFPFDAIPDFFTFFGLIDDLAVLTFVLNQIVKLSPQELKEKHGIR